MCKSNFSLCVQNRFCAWIFQRKGPSFPRFVIYYQHRYYHCYNQHLMLSDTLSLFTVIRFYQLSGYIFDYVFFFPGGSTGKGRREQLAIQSLFDMIETVFVLFVWVTTAQ